MTTQDALEVKTLEITNTIRNACAPVNHYAARCRTCETRWLALEVYDEHGDAPSEWSWEIDKTQDQRG
jgi:hypothetical protein